MSGFFGFISTNKNVLEKEISIFDIIDNNDFLIQEEMTAKTSNYYGRFYRNTVNKFQMDKTFNSNDEKSIIIDGVILNKYDLYEKYKVNNKNIIELIETMTAQNSNSFFNEFRGTFAGLTLDKNGLILFTNHIGDKDVFYHISKENTLYFSTDFETLINLIYVHIGKKFKINANAAYCLMTHSHTLCNETMFESVHRLTPGHYIQFNNKEINKIGYYQLKNKALNISEEDALKKIDKYFRQAIKRSFDKDIEYNYKHLVALSGGLDSRMTTWVAYDMGYTNMLNYTFSQTQYLDQKIPVQISNKLKTEWIFKALDNGTYLYKYMEDSVKISGARSQSSTIAHTMSIINNLNLESYGLIHTGQLGDVVIGTFYDRGKRKNFTPGSGAYSTHLINKVNYTIDNAFEIDDQELFKFYNRGFTGVNTGLKPMYKFTETMSPFQDIDFMEFCLSLPLEYRRGHKIYIKWINQYYPEAAKFIYEKVKGKINRKTFLIKGVPIPWTSIPSASLKLLKNKLGLKLSTKNHMHPMDYWYKNNIQLRNFFYSQFKENINLIRESELRADCVYMFENGNTLVKDQVITILLFHKLMKDFIL